MLNTLSLVIVETGPNGRAIARFIRRDRGRSYRRRLDARLLRLLALAESVASCGQTVDLGNHAISAWRV